jgi:hypothetical protein
VRALYLAVLATGCGRFGFHDAPVSTDAPVVAIDALADASNACPCDAGNLCASDGKCHPVLFEDHFDTATIDPAWSLLRFDFDVESGHLQTLTSPRSGFNYGQGGNGRSAVAALHVGDAAWTDLRVEWTQQSQASLGIVDGTLPACQHSPTMMYRVESYSESWNAAENTDYGFTIDQGASCGGVIGPQGAWSVGQTWQFWIPGQGYSPTHMGDSNALASGMATTITDTPIQFALEMRGTVATLWADGVLIFTEDDSTFTYPMSGDAPLLFGGVAFSSAWEQMFWIDDVVVADLTH